MLKGKQEGNDATLETCDVGTTPSFYVPDRFFKEVFVFVFSWLCFNLIFLFALTEFYDT